MFAFCLRIAGLTVDVAKGGRILERRSGDPLLDGPADKGNPTPVLVNGNVPVNRMGVNWR